MKPFHQAACQTQNFKSHFVSNIIYRGTDGDRNWGWGGGVGGAEGVGTVTREREAVDAAVISNGFISQN